MYSIFQTYKNNNTFAIFTIDFTAKLIIYLSIAIHNFMFYFLFLINSFLFLNFVTTPSIYKYNVVYSFTWFNPIFNFV